MRGTDYQPRTFKLSDAEKQQVQRKLIDKSMEGVHYDERTLAEECGISVYAYVESFTLAEREALRRFFEQTYNAKNASKRKIGR